MRKRRRKEVSLKTLTKDKQQKETDSMYRKFLKGDLYPEIKVTHTRADGVSTDQRLPDNTKFFN